MASGRRHAGQRQSRGPWPEVAYNSNGLSVRPCLTGSLTPRPVCVALGRSLAPILTPLKFGDLDLFVSLPGTPGRKEYYV